MKNVILAFALSVALISGGISGVVMADPPDDNPKGKWARIAESVENIIEQLGDIFLSVTSLDGKLDDLQDDITTLKENSVKMESGVIDVRNGNFSITFQPAHVSLTFVGTPPEGTALWIVIDVYGATIGVLLDTITGPTQTYEFDATGFSIETVESSVLSALGVYTITYPTTD